MTKDHRALGLALRNRATLAHQHSVPGRSDPHGQNHQTAKTSAQSPSASPSSQGPVKMLLVLADVADIVNQGHAGRL